MSKVDDAVSVVQIGGETRRFDFDGVLAPAASQEDAFARVAPLVDASFGGINATVLCYGQTGSGKTHTLGSSAAAAASIVDTSAAAPPASAGVIQRACLRLFRRLEATPSIRARTTLHVSFVEIYKRDMRDLLREGGGDASAAPKACIREGRNGASKLVGVARRSIATFEDAMACLRDGVERRITGSTKMNATSSRSHAAFIVYMSQQIPHLSSGNGDGDVTLSSSGTSSDADVTAAATTTVASKLTFVDLAGSERLARTGAKVGSARALEGIAINSGLSALKSVIAKLAAAQDGSSDDGSARAEHIPYRNSKLTFLLKASLGGNSQTLMFACVACDEVCEGSSSLSLSLALPPSLFLPISLPPLSQPLSPPLPSSLPSLVSTLVQVNCTETVDTLRYARDARRIKNAPTANVTQSAVQLLETQRRALVQEVVALKFGCASPAEVQLILGEARTRSYLRTILDAKGADTSGGAGLHSIGAARPPMPPAGGAFSVAAGAMIPLALVEAAAAVAAEGDDDDDAEALAELFELRQQLVASAAEAALGNGGGDEGEKEDPEAQPEQNHPDDESLRQIERQIKTMVQLDGARKQLHELAGKVACLAREKEALQKEMAAAALKEKDSKGSHNSVAAERTKRLFAKLKELKTKESLMHSTQRALQEKLRKATVKARSVDSLEANLTSLKMEKKRLIKSQNARLKTTRSTKAKNAQQVAKLNSEVSRAKRELNRAQRAGVSTQKMAKRRLAMLEKASKKTRVIEKRMLALTRQMAKTARRRRRRLRHRRRRRTDSTHGFGDEEEEVGEEEEMDESAASDVAIQLLTQSIRRLGLAQYARERLGAVELRRAATLVAISEARDGAAGSSDADLTATTRPPKMTLLGVLADLDHERMLLKEEVTALSRGDCDENDVGEVMSTLAGGSGAHAVVARLIQVATAADAGRRFAADLQLQNKAQSETIAALRTKIASDAASHDGELAAIAQSLSSSAAPREGEVSALGAALDGALQRRVLQLERQLASARDDLAGASQAARASAAQVQQLAFSQECDGSGEIGGDDDDSASSSRRGGARSAAVRKLLSEMALLWVEVGDLSAEEREVCVRNINTSSERLCREAVAALHVRRTTLGVAIGAVEEKTARGALVLGAAASTPRCSPRGSSLAARLRIAKENFASCRVAIDAVHARYIAASADVRDLVERMDLDSGSGELRATLCGDAAFHAAFAASLQQRSRAAVLHFVECSSVDDAPTVPTFLTRDAMVVLETARRDLRVEIGKRIVAVEEAGETIVMLQRSLAHVVPRVLDEDEGTASALPDAVVEWCAIECTGASPISAESVVAVQRALDYLTALGETRGVQEATLTASLNEMHAAAARQSVIEAPLAVRRAAIDAQRSTLAPLSSALITTLERERAVVEALVATALEEAQTTTARLKDSLGLLPDQIESRLGVVDNARWCDFERRCATLRAAAGTASWLTDLSTLRAEIAATLMELRVSKVEMDKFEEECARGRKEVLMSTKSGTRTILRQQESFRKQQIAAWQARIRKLRGSAKRWESEAELKLEIDGVRVLVWAKSESGKRKAIRANNLSTKAVAMSSARRVLVAADENVRVPVKEAEKDKVEPEAVGGFWG